MMKHATKKQQHHGAKVMEAGGTWAEVHSVDEALTALGMHA